MFRHEDTDMAMDRQGTGLTTLRILLGVFWLFEGLGKIRWFTDTSILAGRLSEWMQHAAAGSIGQWYLQRVAMPWLPVWARLVPIGEIGCGVALILGIWTPVAAFIALFMALSFHVAGGTLFRYSFLSNGYGLPVIGSMLALMIGGTRLKWSLR
jgi:uncharacterized membrane protein YphA (DoxX/SURF4 family)